MGYVSINLDSLATILQAQCIRTIILRACNNKRMQIMIISQGIQQLLWNLRTRLSRIWATLLKKRTSSLLDGRPCTTIIASDVKVTELLQFSRPQIKNNSWSTYNTLLYKETFNQNWYGWWCYMLEVHEVIFYVNTQYNVSSSYYLFAEFDFTSIHSDYILKYVISAGLME